MRLILLLLLLYVLYKLFAAPVISMNKEYQNRNIKKDEHKDDTDYTDYEEIK